LNYSNILIKRDFNAKLKLELKSSLDSFKLPVFIRDSADYCQDSIKMYQYNFQLYSGLFEELNDSDFEKLKTLILKDRLNYFIPVLSEDNTSKKNGITLLNLVNGHQEFRYRLKNRKQLVEQDCFNYRKLDTSKYFVHYRKSSSLLSLQKEPDKLIKFNSKGGISTWIINSVSKKHILGLEVALNKRSVKCYSDTLIIEDMSYGIYKNNFNIYLNKEWFVQKQNELVSIKFQRDFGKIVYREEKYYLRDILFLKVDYNTLNKIR
jgi:hypothetical protein